jgi:pimeloyl-ACP methyl ester carboxylesterase
MREVELSAGTIEYEDTGGEGPVLVLSHGVAMNESLWRDVVAELRHHHRCLVPVLPLGGHRVPMRPGADLSMDGIAHILAEFLDRLDLRDVTLVMNDWGGPKLLVANGLDQRVGRLVITSCEAFDNVPPGLPGRMLGIAGAIPGGLNALVQPLRFRPLARLPIAFGWMAKRPIPADVLKSWTKPLLSQRAIRRDLLAYIRSTDGNELVRAAETLASFDRPALVAWAAEDRVMPPEHGRRLAELLPQGRLEEIPDSYTLIPLDQPRVLAAAISGFVAEGRPAARHEHQAV